MVQGLRSHYENFDVRIEKDGESYRTRVSADSSGEGEAAADPSVALAQLDGFLFTVGQARRRSRGRTDLRLREAKKFGAILFESAFRGDALVCLQKALANTSAQKVGMRIRLRLAGVPELSDIPWEFLYSELDKGFFSLSAYTPIVRYLEFPERIRPLDVASPLRILVVISSPTNYPQLDVEQEWTTLKSTLADLEKKKLVVLERLDKPQLAALPRALKNGGFHILHFIGHGEFADDGGELVFEDQWRRGKSVSAEKLGTVLHDQLSLRLVVLNACEGARTSRIDPFSGTAQTLVRQGIPAVLAMQFEITDEAAINFTSEFYSSVAVGDPIDAALADARLKLYALQDDGVEWATPVLHMRSPDGRIFELAPTGPVIDKQKERINRFFTFAGTTRPHLIWPVAPILATIGLIGAALLASFSSYIFHFEVTLFAGLGLIALGALVWVLKPETNAQNTIRLTGLEFALNTPAIAIMTLGVVVVLIGTLYQKTAPHFTKTICLGEFEDNCAGTHQTFLRCDEVRGLTDQQIAARVCQGAPSKTLRTNTKGGDNCGYALIEATCN
jgi:hypothetical protein